jgi:hypothetical protein
MQFGELAIGAASENGAGTRDLDLRLRRHLANEST